jgi:hypothetical protein
MHGLVIALLVLSTQNAGPHTTAALSAEAKHMAMLIGIAPPVPEADGNGDGTAGRQPEVEMDRLVAAMLDVDIATAGINNEINQLNEEQARLQSHSDSRMKKLTIAAILGGVAALVGELIEFDESHERLGSVIETVAASAGIALAAVALREEGHGRTKRDLQFNMLAQMLDRPALPTSSYPDVVWSYFTSQLPGAAGATPRQLLLQHWSEDNLLGKKGRDEATIDRMTSTRARPSTHVDLKMDDIGARIAMLTDVAARVALMKKGLRDLIAELTAEKPRRR